MAKNPLTNERIKKMFKGNFLLTNYAIHIGRDTILSGNFSNLDALLEDIRKKAQATNEEDKGDLGIL